MPVHGKLNATYNDPAAKAKFGENAKSGAIGEAELLRILKRRFPDHHIWVSLRSPSAPGQKQYAIDTPP